MQLTDIILTRTIINRDGNFTEDKSFTTVFLLHSISALKIMTCLRINKQKCPRFFSANIIVAIYHLIWEETIFFKLHPIIFDITPAGSLMCLAYFFHRRGWQLYFYTNRKNKWFLNQKKFIYMYSIRIVDSNVYDKGHVIALNVYNVPSHTPPLNSLTTTTTTL